MNNMLFSILFYFTPLAAQVKQIPLPAELKEAENVPETRFMSEFFYMLFILGIIVVMLYIGAWMFRRMLAQRNQQMNITSNIKIVEQRTLSPKSALYIIEVFGKSMLISESMNGVKFLSEVPENQE